MIDTYSSSVNLSPEQIMHTLSFMSPNDPIAIEIGKQLAMRDITRKVVADQAIDAAKHADKLYDEKFPQC